ncbi:DMT family transporter [Sphingobium sp. DEHP117]|nr:DMT family transporter [Sphingobium sp. DEHP117]
MRGGSRAILLCAAGVAMFSMMDVLMKGASLAAGAYTALFWRNMLATLMSGAAMARTPYRWPPASVMRLHILRAMLIAPMAWLFFWSLTKLPLAEVIGLSFIAPIIALALAPVLLGEKVQPNEIGAALLGVAGVAIILSGRFSGAYSIDALWGAAAVLVSAALFALNLLVQRRQAQVAGAIEVAFFQNVFVLALLLPFAPWMMGSVGSFSSWLAVASAAALTVGSQIALSSAYARAPASRLIPLEYSAFLWACIWGWLVFAEVPTLTVLAGVVLIVAACLLAARQTPGIARVEAESA